jgi:hypothetical protein
LGVSFGFRYLFDTAVQITDMIFRTGYNLPVQGYFTTVYAVGTGMLGPHIQMQFLGSGHILTSSAAN